MGAVRGKDFKLYYNSDDPYDNTPTWVELKDVHDLSRNVEKALADASIRGTKFRQQVGTLFDLTVDFDMVYDQADAGYVAVETAFYNEKDLEILILDGPIATVGSKGIRFMSQVNKFGTDEKLEDVGRTNVSLVPSYFPTNVPRRVQVAVAGSVVDV